MCRPMLTLVQACELAWPEVTALTLHALDCYVSRVVPGYPLPTLGWGLYHCEKLRTLTLLHPCNVVHLFAALEHRCYALTQLNLTFDAEGHHELRALHSPHESGGTTSTALALTSLMHVTSGSRMHIVVTAVGFVERLHEVDIRDTLLLVHADLQQLEVACAREWYTWAEWPHGTTAQRAAELLDERRRGGGEKRTHYPEEEARRVRLRCTPTPADEPQQVGMHLRAAPSTHAALSEPAAACARSTTSLPM